MENRKQKFSSTNLLYCSRVFSPTLASMRRKLLLKALESFSTSLNLLIDTKDGNVSGISIFQRYFAHNSQTNFKKRFCVIDEWRRPGWLVYVHIRQRPKKSFAYAHDKTNLKCSLEKFESKLKYETARICLHASFHQNKFNKHVNG